MRLLADRLAGLDGPKRGVTVPYSLIIRGSTAAPKR
jgi:DNA-binding LacI/PurR family transcriptional regulator